MHLGLDFLDDFVDQIKVDMGLVRQKTLQQDTVKQRVDAPRNTPRMAVNAVEYFRVKSGFVRGARTLQSVKNVFTGFIGVQGPQMAGGSHALAQLHHAGALQNLTELRLADQKGLQQSILSILEVGQHSQLFHRLGLQVLRLVNDEQTALA